MKKINALSRLHAALLEAAAGVAELIAAEQTSSDPYREPNGSRNLSQAGIDEINRRFASGEKNNKIAEEMGIARVSVKKRRSMWKRTLPASAAE